MWANLKRSVYVELVRIAFNFWPCLRGAGGRVTYIAKDFSKLTVKLKFNWRTRNVVGTIFGGSLYASTDPFYMLMLMQILGKDYVVWDKGCTIKFKRPAKETLYANFEITPAMVEKIKADVAQQNEITFTWPLQYKNKDGLVFTEFEKVLYVTRKDFYKEKLKLKKAATIAT